MKKQRSEAESAQWSAKTNYGVSLETKSWFLEMKWGGGTEVSAGNGVSKTAR